MVYFLMATSVLEESMMAQETLTEETTKSAASDIGMNLLKGLFSSILEVVHELHLCMDVARLLPGLVEILINLSYCLTFPFKKL